jgi:phosphoribosylanthranilate isomerase
VVELKFCGLTRPEDAARAAALGASYAGVIFAGGPRQLTPARAREVLAPLVGTSARRVGVFGQAAPDEILRIARESALDVLQLAGDAEGVTLRALRERFDGAIWPVVHLSPDAPDVPAAAGAHLAEGADAVVLDARMSGRLGGTGVALDWAAIAPAVARLRTQGRVVLAGGLRQENVARAIALLHPDVVDVSSGVESAPGIKDPERMRAFAAATFAHEV